MLSFLRDADSISYPNLAFHIYCAKYSEERHHLWWPRGRDQLEPFFKRGHRLHSPISPMDQIAHNAASRLIRRRSWRTAKPAHQFKWWVQYIPLYSEVGATIQRFEGRRIHQDSVSTCLQALSRLRLAEAGQPLDSPIYMAASRLIISSPQGHILGLIMNYDSSLRNQIKPLFIPNISGARGGSLHLPSHAKAPRWSSADRVAAVHESPSHVNAAGRFDAPPHAQAIPAQSRRASGWDETRVRLPESSTLCDQVLTDTPHSVLLGLQSDAGHADLALREISPESIHERATMSSVDCRFPESRMAWEYQPPFPFAAFHTQSTSACGTIATST